MSVIENIQKILQSLNDHGMTRAGKSDSLKELQIPDTESKISLISGTIPCTKIKDSRVIIQFSPLESGKKVCVSANCPLIPHCVLYESAPAKRSVLPI